MEEAQIIKYMMEKKYIDDEYICWDFVIDVIKDMYGVVLPEYPVDEVQTDFKNKLVSNFKHEKIDMDWAREGDIVVFSMFANQHAGVMINSKDFIHLSREGVKTTSLRNLIGKHAIYRIER